MIDYDAIFALPPFSLTKSEKHILLSENIAKLTQYHYENCVEYKKILQSFGYDFKNTDYYDTPFLPVRLFKEYELKSVPKQDVIKTMTSSGTSGQKTSKIFLDKQTAANQSKALSKIVSDFIGTKRLPMIVIDSPDVLKNRISFSARGAGILGFSIFAKDRIFALRGDNTLDLDSINAFLERYKGEKILIFGFTFMVWQHFYRTLSSLGISLDLSDFVLIHGGGWKKILNLAVSKTQFKAALKSVCGSGIVCDYYGMVEQTGSIFMECDFGHLHTPNFADVITRRALDFSVAEFGEVGILELISILPHSYPGHVILSEDLGVILGEDNCPCGRKGKYFEIKGRIQNAEIRGCSDT